MWRGVAPILFSTHVTSENRATRSAHVSVRRLRVVTRLTEYAVYVGSCDRARGSSSGVRRLYATGYNILCWPMHGLTCGLPASAAVPRTVVYIRLSSVNKRIIALPSRVGIHRNSSAGAPGRGHSVPLYKRMTVCPDLLSVGGGTLYPMPARFGTHYPPGVISGEAEPECYTPTDFVA